jgi:hypothetical protein
VPAVHLLEEALSAATVGDSALKARILSSLARALYFSGSLERAYLVGQRAVEMARRIRDPVTLIWTLNITYYSLRRPDNLKERLAGATEIIKLSSQLPESNALVELYAWVIFDLIETGDAQVKARLEIFQREAERIRQPFYL